MEGEYRYIVDRFLQGGVTNFIFETNAHDRALHETAAYIKAQCPSAYIVVCFAAQPDGFTCAGERVQVLLQRAGSDPNMDATGINCVSSARHMVQMVDTLQVDGLTLSALPNAGYPTVVGGRTIYNADPDNIAQQMKL